MRRFPAVTALAEAREEEVLQAWAGLGYYARARNLHKGAQAVVARGRWPDTAEDWERIPGVGPYTAGAIASIAFGRRAPILDGNIVRVFSRLFGLDFLPGGGAAEKRAYWDLARLWSDGARPGELNEALMELGALVCVPGAPRCDRCPLSAACAARAEGWETRLPPVKPRPRMEEVPAVAVLATRRGEVLGEERGPGSFLAGHVVFPLFVAGEAAEWREGFRRRFPGWEIATARAAGGVRHAIMSRRYRVEVWNVGLRPAPGRGRTSGAHRGGTGRPEDAARWLPLATLEERLTNSLARKIWKAAREAPV